MALTMPVFTPAHAHVCTLLLMRMYAHCSYVICRLPLHIYMYMDVHSIYMYVHMHIVF